MDQEEYNGLAERPNRHRRPDDDGNDRFLMLRNVLNIIFMLGAVVGVVYFLSADKYTGTLIILGAMAFKIAESALRLFRH